MNPNLMNCLIRFRETESTQKSWSNVNRKIEGRLCSVKFIG